MNTEKLKTSAIGEIDTRRRQLSELSLTMLLIAILTGTIPAMLIRRALELDLKNKISIYFTQNTEI